MTTLTMPTSLRKAAILVATLDDRAADALLEQMGSEMAARVRNAIMELGDIPADEQEQVIAEFLGRGEPETIDDDGVELSPSLMEQLRDKEVTDSFESRGQQIAGSPARSARPFASLEHVEPAALARALDGEHPQTIAVVLAHMQPEQVAEILARLPSETSIEALARMARIDDLAPEVLDDIERELLARVPKYSTKWLKPEGVANIQAVLEVLDESRRKELLESLERKDVRLLRRLGYVPSGERPFADVEPPAKPVEMATAHSRISMTRISSLTGTASEQQTSRAAEHGRESRPSVDLSSNPAQLDRRRADQPVKRDVAITFEQFGQLNDRALRRIVEEADSHVVEIALTGADPQLIRRVLRLLPARVAADWRRRIERPGPLRLRDIELARHLLERLASILARRREITLPRSRFAAAA